MEIAKTEELKRYTYWKNAEIPIVIGVSAHRNIEEKYVPKIKEEVGKVIDYFLDKYPDTPILMLNGLAKGGDMLCAEVAKEKFQEGKPVRICAVIPDEEEEYLNAGTEDFGPDFSEEDIKKFKDLKNFETENGKLVTEVFVAPNMEAVPEMTRDYKFRRQAIYVATKCHVLLALWDGKGAKGKDGKGIKNTDCGTPAAVEFALKHNYYQPHGEEFCSAYDGAVIKILSPREGNFDETAGTRTYLTPENPEEESKEFPKKLNEVLVRTNLFNKNYHDYCKKQKRLLRKKEKKGGDIAQLIKPADYHFLIGKDEYDKGSAHLKHIHDCYAIASELSAENKKIFSGFLSVLAVFGFLLLFGFMLYDQLNMLWTVVVFLAVMLALIFAYAWVKARGNPHVLTWFKLKGKPCGVHTKFLEYRALSETLRVQYYLLTCGVYYNAGNSFTWSHKNEIIWIKKAVTALFIGNDEALWKSEELKRKYLKISADESYKEKRIINYGGGEIEKSVCLDIIFSKWVGSNEKEADKNTNGQIGYHLKTKEEMVKALKKNKSIGLTISLITIAAYFVLFVFELLIRVKVFKGIDLDKELFWIVNGRMLFKILLCVASAGAFAISYYFGKLSLNRKIADSENMIKLYTIAIKRANAIFKSDLLYDTPEAKEKAFNSLLRGLAHEQIIENGVWISYNRDNNVDLPL